MMEPSEVPEKQGEIENQFGEADPVKWDDRDGRSTRKNFRFGSTHVGSLDTFTCSIGDVETEVREDTLVWKYHGKCPVIIMDERVLTPKACNRKERERQTYYALSYLDSKGLVSGWGEA